MPIVLFRLGRNKVQLLLAAGRQPRRQVGDQTTSSDVIDRMIIVNVVGARVGLQPQLSLPTVSMRAYIVGAFTFVHCC